MRHLFFTLMLIGCLLTSWSSQAQITATMPANTIAITNDTTYTLTFNGGGGGANYSFLVCNGVHLTVTGMST